VLFNNQSEWWEEGNQEQYRAIKNEAGSELEAEFVVDGAYGRAEYLRSSLPKTSFPNSKLTLIGIENLNRIIDG
jgi:hypothetical protein